MRAYPKQTSSTGEVRDIAMCSIDWVRFCFVTMVTTDSDGEPGVRESHMAIA